MLQMLYTASVRQRCIAPIAMQIVTNIRAFYREETQMRKRVGAKGREAPEFICGARKRNRGEKSIGY